MIPPIATATTGPVPPLPGGSAAGVTVASVDTGPPAVSTCTATVAGSRAGAGNVSRYRVPSAVVTSSNAPMTPEGPAVTAIPPVPSATAVQNGDAVSPDPTHRQHHARSPHPLDDGRGRLTPGVGGTGVEHDEPRIGRPGP